MKNLLDLNELKVREPRKKVVIEATSDNTNYDVKVQQEYADHVLVVGERYQSEDVRLTYSSHLGKFSSGVMRELKEIFSLISFN